VDWRKDLKTLYSASVIGWQSAASPVLDSGLLLVHCNSPLEPVLALRALDGELQWRARADRMTHSSPVVATIDGVRQVIFATQVGLISFDTATGRQLWKETYPFSYSTSLAASPLVAGNVVFITGAYSMQGMAVQVSKRATDWEVTRLWLAPNFRAHWMSPVHHEGHVYGLSGSSTTSSLKCLNLLTGQELWSRSGFGRGGVLLVDGILLVLSEKGDLVLVEPAPEGYVELGRATLFPGYDPNRNKCWNVPAIADGKVYARSTAEAVCLDLSLPGRLRISEIRTTPAGLLLQVGSDSGAALDISHLQKLRLRASPTLAVPLEQWPTVPCSVGENGFLRVDEPDSVNSRFFVVTEEL
jgi:outer membrane protein assembly factor BamB